MTKFIPILVMRGVRKMFGTTVALDHVDLDVGAGEVHAVIGENGAGKSTLMKILCGVIPPDEGEIQLGGEPYRPRGPHHAMRNGLAMIHQELNLAPHLTAEANILLGMENSRAGFLRAGVNLPRARATLDQLRRPDIPLDLPVRQLGIGEQQIIEIARALAVNARIIVMDEPTSSLSGEDRLHLFQVIRRLKERGISVIYISHFLEEVREICDRFTVLRDGKTVGTGEVASTPQSELIRMMVGRKIEDIFPPRDRTPGEPVLSVGKLRGTKLPREASLQLYRGEILGLAGLVGAGRTETLRAIFGLDPIVSGSARLAAATAGGEIALTGGPRHRVRRGIGMLSEDRKTEGLATNLSVAENIVMTPSRSAIGAISRFGFLRARAVREASNKWIGELAIRSAAPDTKVANLSGGNQQKVAIARLLHMEADIFLLDEPTRGIDIGSKAEIYKLMDKLARRGKAVIFVSSYLPELLGLCDRIGVMARGTIMEIRPTSDWTEHDVMQMAIGTEIIQE